MTLKKGDFIEIDYIATDKEINKVFDLTSEENAKKLGIFNKDSKYGPIIICIGENQVIKGLDDSLIGKETKKEYDIEIPPESGFGKKDTKLLRMIPSRSFKSQKINPFPGLQINMDGMIGTIRTVSGGRSIVDFNHPLSGHNLLYHITINKVVTNDQEKIESILSFLAKDFKVSIKEATANITIKIPEIIQKQIEGRIKKLIPSIKKIIFKE